jgi:hypothetical protein
MKYKILGIAINEYDDFDLNKINNCLNDVNEIVSLLTSRYSFDEVELLSNKEQTTRKFIHNRLYDYFINSLEDENVLLIYTGHGEYNSTIKTSYWLPSDASPKDPSSWFNINDLLMYLRAAKAFHINIISDSCFSGGIFETASRGGGIDAFNKKKSRLALTSGSIEKVSDGIKGNLSPFTSNLCEVLTQNDENELSFLTLANEVITRFNSGRNQTPMFGSLANVGHEGGSLIFHLKDKNEGIKKNGFDFSEISLGLNIDIPINIDYECKIPLFSENKVFDNIFVNTFIQHRAYNVISDTRTYINEDKDFIIERNKEIGFSVNISYTIHTLNDKLLSLTIAVESYLGSMHPNNYISSLNIAFKPERILNLYDIIKFGDFQEFIKPMIEKYSVDEEHKETLKHYSEYITSHNLDFSVNDKTLSLYFLNHMPRAFIALGFLDIPIEQLELKV